MKIPSLEDGLAALGEELDKDLVPIAENFESARDFAQKAAEVSPALASSAALEELATTLSNKYDSQRVGHLISDYVLNRDKQMQTLQSMGGKDVMLAVLSQGILPAELSSQLGIAYDTFHEFMRITCTPDELSHMEMLAADSLIATGLKELRASTDKDDLARAKALMDVNMKLAKALSNKYSEQKPSTAVQINNFGDDQAREVGKEPEAWLSIVMKNKEDLEPLKDHSFTSEEQNNKFKPDGIIDGEFTLYNGE